MPWLLAFVVGILLIILLRSVLFQKDSSNAARLMKTYKHLTSDTLAAVPDEELVAAVVANLLAKAEAENRDPYAVIPALSQERCTVYSVWAVMRELQSGDPQSLRHQGQFGFSELAADGLDMLGVEDAAAALRTYLQTAEETHLHVITEAFDRVNIGQILVTFIRDHAPAFCDE